MHLMIMHLLYIYIYIYIYIYKHYRLLFITNDKFRYTATSQRRSFSFLSLLYIFFISSFSFALSLFKPLRTKKHRVYNLYCISYTLSIWYVMYFVVSETFTGGRFLDDCFYCYSKQIISALAIEFLSPNDYIKENQKQRTFNTVTPNVSPNQIRKKLKYSSVFENKKFCFIFLSR